MEPETMKIEVGRGSGRSWKRSWHENCLGGCLGRFWPILDRRGEAKMAPRWPPRWSQDGAKMGPRGAQGKGPRADAKKSGANLGHPLLALNSLYRPQSLRAYGDSALFGTWNQPEGASPYRKAQKFSEATKNKKKFNLPEQKSDG